MPKKKSLNDHSQKMDLKKEMSWKNNLFSRYMLFRYSLALFFFANLYWIMILIYKQAFYMILPLLMIVVLIIAVAEQFRLYGKKEAVLPWTKRAFQAQIVVNVLAIIIALLPNQMPIAFPVFADTMAGIIFVIVMQALAIIICLYNLKRAHKVERNADRFYYRFQKSFGNIN